MNRAEFDDLQAAEYATALMYAERDIKELKRDILDLRHALLQVRKLLDAYETRDAIVEFIEEVLA
jgi:hypothetical protein